MTYDSAFRFIVVTGVGCGLDHPYEWALNAWRTPGGSMHPEWYEEFAPHLARFLVEITDALSQQGVEMPADAAGVLARVDQHFAGEDGKGIYAFVALISDEVRILIRDEIAAYEQLDDDARNARDREAMRDPRFAVWRSL